MADGDEEMGTPAPSGDSDEVTTDEDSAGAEPASDETDDRAVSPEDGTTESGTEATADSGAEDREQSTSQPQSDDTADGDSSDSAEDHHASAEHSQNPETESDDEDDADEKTDDDGGDDEEDGEGDTGETDNDGGSDEEDGESDTGETDDDGGSDEEDGESETDHRGDSDQSDVAAGADGTVEGPSTTIGAMPDGAQAAAPAVEESTEESFEGAPGDEEMPLTEHIEEMIKRLAAVIVVMGGVSLVVFPVAPDLINWLWYSYLPGSPEACATGTSESTACPRVYHPLGLLFSRIKVASLVGFIVALPVFVYQTYLFMRPGLYPHERRYYLAAVPTSLLLAFVGLAFSYFLVLPVIFTYFLFYSEDVAEIAFGLTETFDLILLMMGTFAAIFQIPLFIMLAIMMGVTTRHWLEQKRYYFWLGFAGFAFIFSPDPTGMAPFIVGITMVALYELTLLLLRWTGR